MKNLSPRMLEKIAVELAKKAGRKLRKYRSRVEIVKNKGRALDFATEADIEVEKFLRSEIGRIFPDHGIVGEEEGVTNPKAEYVWFLDPLDGTIDFIRGFPTFNVLIAIEHIGKLIVGCVHRPLLNETFSGARRSGVRSNTTAANVSNAGSLQEAMIHFKLPRCVHGRNEIKQTSEILNGLANEVGLIREGWEDSVGMASVASGMSEAFILTISGTKWWDVAPGILMVEEAGGKVTDMFGEPIKHHDLSRGLVASNGKIHQQLLEIIRKCIG